MSKQMCTQGRLDLHEGKKCHSLVWLMVQHHHPRTLQAPQPSRLGMAVEGKAGNRGQGFRRDYRFRKQGGGGLALEEVLCWVFFASFFFRIYFIIIIGVVFLCLWVSLWVLLGYFQVFKMVFLSARNEDSPSRNILTKNGQRLEPDFCWKRFTTIPGSVLLVSMESYFQTSTFQMRVLSSHIRIFCTLPYPCSCTPTHTICHQYIMDKFFPFSFHSYAQSLLKSKDVVGI